MTLRGKWYVVTGGEIESGDRWWNSEYRVWEKVDKRNIGILVNYFTTPVIRKEKGKK